MKCLLLRLLFVLVLVGSLLVCRPMAAQLHRATRLGNPATRFAPPLFAPDDLRSRFKDEKLQPDFIAVLKQWGWQGDPTDLFRAALTNAIAETSLKVGERIPFMSTRENGKPICLRDVLWAGKDPAPAYAFNFSSQGRRYRCVTPKACSNFFVEDLGPEPVAALTLSCNAPDEVPTGRAVDICLTLVNQGNAVAPRTRLVLPMPPDARLTSRTDSALVKSNELVWEIAQLAPNQGKQVCATFKLAQPGTLHFDATGTSAATNHVLTSCQTRVVGVPAILLEVIDLEDPVELGKEVTYEIKVTNQGTVTGTNVRLVCAIPKSEQFVSAAGSTPARFADGVVTMQAATSLPAKEALTWRVVVKALEMDDARFKVELRSDQFERPILEDESTQLY